MIGPVSCGHQDFHVPAKRFIEFVTEHLLSGAIEILYGALSIYRDDGVRRSIHDGFGERP